MATGIQTGIRSRGSRVPSPAPATRLSAMGAVWGRWTALSRRVKVAIILSAVALQGLLVAFGVHSRQSGLVDLYPTKLQADELPEISRTLLAVGIEHEVTPKEDGIQLSRDQRTRARAVLASHNLPLNRILTDLDDSATRSSSDRRALQQRVLEGEIVLALREMEGVRDARVKLALPEQRFYNDGDPVQASVILTTRPAHRFSREAINGMLNLVAFSVPGLTPQNVQLSDQRGHDLSAEIPHDADGGLAMSGVHFEISSAEEKRAEQKLQEVFDEIYPGRVRVLVNVDLDFSQSEQRRYTPGSEKDDGLVKSGYQVVTESLDGEGKDREFDNRKESANFKFNEYYNATLDKYARVRHVSATVFADGFSDKQAARLEQAVSGALGLRDDRGDFVFVDSTPWDHEDLTQSATAAPSQSPLALDPSDEAPASHYGLLGLLLAQSALMMGGFAYLTSRKRSQAQVEMVAPSGLVPTGIVDHARAKNGQTLIDMNRTGAQTTELLEGIVRERPNQVADLLRSTWLS